MPELPEVETMRRGVQAIVGSRIVDVRRPKCAKRPILVAPRIDSLCRRTCGCTITAVDRIGKRVVVRLDSGDALVFEPRMTGLVLLAAPPTPEHLRLQVKLAGGDIDELLFWDRRGLGSVRLVSPSEFAVRYGSGDIGPDALMVTADELRARLKHSRRAIKVALLDQKALAGIGNLYASEMLHVAGIHPAKPCDQLRPAQWRKLHAAMHEVLEMAIRYEGSTLGDGTYRNALNQQGSYQNHHRVYNRAGDVCPGCGKATIERIVQTQRSTFFCPRCQRAPQQRRRSPSS
ncbi:MAG: bifunctional DNA-formamidopyrimidine glycosylase/DNA-(apurinic or apyrimidinic site) lyase [Planctomycetota bacterium]|nr:MAG: bifunctional DNA-formamidopyrimidine glycosylase/DNA-(apurinic or apyrimidinic site) lyase [Planctomycetota bacterium]